jgi:hypothetical protein
LAPEPIDDSGYGLAPNIGAGENVSLQRQSTAATDIVRL